METSKSFKVVIAADNALVVNGLRHNLENNFGETMHITGCYDVRVLLRNITPHTDIVVLDYYFDGISGEHLRRKISKVNPSTSVIMHSTPQEVISELNKVIEVEKPATHKKISYKLVNQYL